MSSSPADQGTYLFHLVHSYLSRPKPPSLDSLETTNPNIDDKKKNEFLNDYTKAPNFNS
jgi:hypothetical protein